MRKFINDESGQAVTEYFLIIALLAAAVAMSISGMRNEIANIYEYIGNKVSDAASSM